MTELLDIKSDGMSTCESCCYANYYSWCYKFNMQSHREEETPDGELPWRCMYYITWGLHISGRLVQQVTPNKRIKSEYI